MNKRLAVILAAVTALFIGAAPSAAQVTFSPVQGEFEFDELTDKTVRELQQAFGYTVDGVVGPGTHKLINAQIGHGWSAEGKKSEPQKAGDKAMAATVPGKKAPPEKG